MRKGGGVRLWCKKGGGGSGYGVRRWGGSGYGVRHRGGGGGSGYGEKAGGGSGYGEKVGKGVIGEGYTCVTGNDSRAIVAARVALYGTLALSIVQQRIVTFITRYHDYNTGII